MIDESVSLEEARDEFVTPMGNYGGAVGHQPDDGSDPCPFDDCSRRDEYG